MGMLATFLVYFIFSYFAMLNVMTGIFCHNAIDSAAKDKDLATVQMVVDRDRWMASMADLFHVVDSDKSGTLDIQEFECHVSDERVIAQFATLDVDVTDAWAIFMMLDDDKQGTIDLDEFCDGLMRLKGPAKAIHMAKMSHENKRLKRKLELFMEEVYTILRKGYDVEATL